MKTLTPENWLQPDATLLAFVSVTPAGITPLEAQDWTTVILEHQLPEHLPPGVRSLYDSGRAAICYGAFYYPLYTAGLELLTRALEAAVTAFADGRVSAAPGRARGFDFNAKIHALRQAGYLSAEVTRHWHDLRAFRNLSLHADAQNVIPPAVIIDLLNTFTGEIMALFAGKAITEPMFGSNEGRATK